MLVEHKRRWGVDALVTVCDRMLLEHELFYDVPRLWVGKRLRPACDQVYLNAGQSLESSRNSTAPGARMCYQLAPVL